MNRGKYRLVGLLCALVSFALTARTQADGGHAASLGREVSIGEAMDGYVGRLDVWPAHAPAGTEVTLTAEHLPPGEEFQLVWATAIGSWKVTDAEYHGRDFTPVAYEIARTKTDSSGGL